MNKKQIFFLLGIWMELWGSVKNQLLVALLKLQQIIRVRAFWSEPSFTWEDPLLLLYGVAALLQVFDINGINDLKNEMNEEVENHPGWTGSGSNACCDTFCSYFFGFIFDKFDVTHLKGWERGRVITNNGVGWVK